MELFKANSGKWVTEKNIYDALEAVDAHKAEYLYVHSDMSFGMPNPDLNRSRLLEIVLNTILDTGADNIIFPSFTFSFPNGWDYDVKKSKTLMGALNDFARKDARGIRSVDPIMSNVHFGKERALVTDIGKCSCGEGSTYHMLSEKNNVKFLFFGVHPSVCFTYSHFIEERLKVPYRYNRPFSGYITDAEGNTYKDTYELFVRYKGVVAGCNPVINEASLQNGSQKAVRCGDSTVHTYDKDKITDLYIKFIKSDMNFMLAKEPPKLLLKEYIIDNPPVVAM